LRLCRARYSNRASQSIGIGIGIVAVFACLCSPRYGLGGCDLDCVGCIGYRAFIQDLVRTIRCLFARFFRAKIAACHSGTSCSDFGSFVM
jgi:hypothetical protein